jgi:hypothetical protein
MNKTSQKIGSWNGLTLIRQIGPSSSGAHHHTSHMLRLQMRSVITNEWRCGDKCGTTIMEPGSLAAFSAGAHHRTCTDKRRDDSAEEPQHMIALLTESLLEQAAEAASERNGSIQLRENRHFRDLQLERLLWILHDETLKALQVLCLGIQSATP